MEETICNCLAIRQAARQVSQLYDTELAPLGLRTTQYSLLMKLWRLGPSTMQALADVLVMDRSTLGHNVQPLQRAGLVAVVPSEADRRVRNLALTQLGLETLTAAKKAWKRAQRRFDDRFGAAESAQLRRLLRLAVEAAKPTPRTKSVRA